MRILHHSLTELLKYGDQYNVARCALLLARLYLFDITEDRTNVHSEAEHLLLLAKDILTSFHETLLLKLTYLYLVSQNAKKCVENDWIVFQVFTYHDSNQVEKRKQMTKFYKQIDVKLDTKPIVI